MKLKLDENLGTRGRDLLEQAGHDVCTVPAQDLCAATDQEVAARCLADARGIVTLDLDFANPFRFPPSQHHGIAVLRGPARMSEEALHRLLSTFASALKNQPFHGALWILEDGRIRVFQAPLYTGSVRHIQVAEINLRLFSLPNQGLKRYDALPCFPQQ